MARVVAVAPDLILGSRIETALRAAGHEVSLAASLSEAPLEDADLLVADLDTEPAEAVVGLGIPVLGYYQHTKVEVRQTAEAAGVDLVVPRSKLVRELPQLADGLLSRSP